MQEIRTNWERNWEDVAEYILPRKDDVYGFRMKGEQKFQRLYDSTSIHSNELLASALSGMLISQTSKWMQLSLGDPELDKDPETRYWLEDASDKMLAVYDGSNFYTEMHETFLDLGSLGTSTVFQEEHPDTVVSFCSRPIYGFYIDVDQFKKVVTVAYEYKMTYKQLFMEFGEKVLPADVVRRGKADELAEFTVIHFVEPNIDFDTKSPRIETNRPIRSIHILKDTKTTLKKSGYHEMPFAIPRWTVTNNEMFGRSPGMKAMPDIRMVNAMMKVVIRGAQKVVDPVLMVPDQGFLLPIDTTPGGVNFYRGGQKDRIEPLVTGSRPDIGLDIVDAYRQQIRQAFFIDQLQLREGPQMTATEVMQRTEEQLRLLGPIVSRLNSELLRPIVDRTFGIMMRKKMFLPPPATLKGRTIKIKFISQIAKAQKASQADTLLRVIQSVAPIIQAQPDIMDNFDGDSTLREHADIFGLSERMFKKPSEVMKLRNQRAQQQQEAVATEQNNMEADTLQKLASTQQV